MNNNKKQEIDKEVLAEEYRLGKEYYNKLLEKSPKETEKYNYIRLYFFIDNCQVNCQYMSNQK